MKTVKSLLTIPSLSELKVIAGFNGLNREIKAVSIMDAPDSYKWLKGGEFILTSGFMFGGDEWQLEHFINNLINANVSAIGIKRGRFISNISESIKLLADEANFPVIEIPYHFGWSDIISSYYDTQSGAKVSEISIEKNPASSSREEFYQSILCSLKKNNLTQSISCMSDELYKPDETVVTGVLLISSDNIDKIYGNIKKLLSDIHFLRMGKVSAFYEKEFCASYALVILEFLPSSCEFITKWQFMLYNELGYCAYENKEDAIAISNFYSGINNITTSYNEAKEALLIGKALWEDKKCFSYPLLSAYVVLNTTDLAMVDLSCLSILENYEGRLSFDAIKTIETYIECGNYKDAAKKLYIHENTLRYRLSKIEEILLLDMNDAIVRNALIAQIKCKKLQNISTELRRSP